MQRSRLFLLLAAFPVAAVVGGIALGQWLAMRAPVDQAAVAAAAQKGPVDISRLPLADGNGVPEPPQPLPDGSRGVPPKVLTAARSIPTVSASVAAAPPQGVTVSTQRPSASALAAAAPTPWADGGALPAQRVGVATEVVPVNTMDDGGFIPAQAPGTAVAQPAPAARAQVVSSRPPSNPNMPAWQRVLRIALERCESQGPAGAACAQEARENYCENNGGWGQVAECAR